MELGIPRIRMRAVARIYDAMKVGILITDRKGIVIWGNRYYSKIAEFDIRQYFGRSVREISQREMVRLTGPELMLDYVLRTGQEKREIVKYHTEDYVITTATPVPGDDGALEYVLYTCTNYSETLRIEQDLSAAHARVEALEQELYELQFKQLLEEDIVVSNEAMRRIFRMGNRLSGISVSVMVLGESGVGKDVLAKYIHRAGPRREGRFVHVNLGAIPKSLFESQLFGYAPGAFTGASKNGKVGLIQMADGGTLFLDEVGELPLDIQTKLLQVVQEKTVRAIGSTQDTAVDIRIISATNRDLKAMVAEGTFRLDLYYRLNVVEVTVPPLRQRRDDIPLMAAQFLARYNRRYSRGKVLSPEALHLFLDYPWPGNVRELRHMVESLVAIGEDPVIRPEHLSRELREAARPRRGAELAAGGLKDAVAELEREMIGAALARCGTAAQAADLLRLEPSTLAKKRKKYGI